jgi:hypothetical protein
VLGAAERAGIVQNLLGPISKSIGENWAERYRQRNLARLVRKGARRVGSQLGQPGGVHPRVAHRILEEGSYVEDDVMLEYLAGILAAARTPGGQDDRGAYFANLVAALSANQIRLHHALYSAIATAELEEGEDFGNGDTLARYSVLTTVDDTPELLQDHDELAPNPKSMVGETVLGLYREGLVSDYFLGFADEPVSATGAVQKRDVVFVVGSHVGLLLYLWAYGFQDGDVNLLRRCLEEPFDPPGPVFSSFTLTPYRHRRRTAT